MTSHVLDAGLRSPGALTYGHSIKEFEEQLSNLRKENFNLKLRIYFLEERMGANFNSDNESDLKNNIELMVELQNVRKELEDKQDLLCQAAKALEIEEEERKREVSLRDNQILELESALDLVRIQLQKTEPSGYEVHEPIGLPGTSEMVRHLQCTIRDLQAEVRIFSLLSEQRLCELGTCLKTCCTGTCRHVLYT